ncbi:imm11 family protein [Corallococcus exercitus]|uniref:imm11 family protein n=1 Tax=Corallococcus exercitus TaxID=2316736 RepID=UPI0035D42136
MSSRYFDLSDDVYLEGRWELGHPQDAQGNELKNPWQIFRKGRPSSWAGRVRIPIDIPGSVLDYSHASGSIPVVTSRVAAIFERLAPNDVQLFPVDIEGQQPDEFFILNAIRRVNCIDDVASEQVRYWTPEDGLAEKVGTYTFVWGMRIDATRLGSARVFRPLHWEVVLVIPEDIKLALESIGATGVWFKDVSPLR